MPTGNDPEEIGISIIRTKVRLLTQVRLLTLLDAFVVCVLLSTVRVEHSASLL